ncbi:MAG: family 78 glycoside hydrolase catalytic domain [Candidatus Hydrogenedentes bacterium]|nr:family 78 glycoside hydrolase catalytic domain [Candidatus Hydrogenedentota bacterium]
MPRLGLFFSASVLLMSAGVADAACKVTDLRCEYLSDPLGIDVVNPRLSWVLDTSKHGARQTAYQVLVADDESLLKADQGNVWDSGRVESDQSVQVVYGGKPLESRARCFWKVRVWDESGQASPWSAPAFWTMGLLSLAEWQGQWIGCDWMKDNAGALPWMRKTFEIESAPARAEISVCALGYYELFINGEKVGDAVLSPATTDYSTRGLSITHDVASLLKPGKNCVALWLGRGWSMPALEPASQSGPLVRAQLDIMALDGSRATIVTDETWKIHPSCITPLGKGSSGDYGGESYDARLEVPDWNAVGYDDSTWAAAKAFNPPTPVIATQPVEPNRIIGKIKPVSVKPFQSGYLVDMGRNYSGWFRIKFPALKDGQTVTMEFADKQFPDGKLQTYNQRDTYIGRKGSNAFCNRFNYHAFRYAFIQGLDREPKLSEITGLPISTDYEPAASFECSNPLLNDIYTTAVWTYRCLSLGGYTVDCPHRERLGYGGDSGTSMEMGMTNFRLGAFYNKWAADWRNAQNEAGDVPHTCPGPQIGGGGPAWSGFCITLPWQIYVQYGDRRVLEQSYPTMKRWLAFIDTKMGDGILQPYAGIGIDAQWSFLGDWVPPGRDQGANRVDERSTLFFNNCYLVHCLQLAAKVAAIVGDSAQSAVYTEKAETLAKVLHERFLNPDHATYVNGEQTYLAMPLLFKITPEDLRPTVMDALEHDIVVTRKGHLNSGMHGTYYLAKYLMLTGRNDLVYTMVSQDTFPSWGFMLKNGATTIWEEFNGDNSQIHNTLISIGMWFIQGLGGIRWDENEPGYKHVIIAPGVVEGLNYVKSSNRSPYGTIVSEWARKKNRIEFHIVVPANSHATVTLPSGDYGKGLEDVRVVEQADKQVVCEVPAGEYRFVCRQS